MNENKEVNNLHEEMSKAFTSFHKEKSLNISDINGAKKNIDDLEIYGDGDTFRLLCKASSQKEGWMKSTKVCNLNNGCLVQVTTQQRNIDGTYSLAEAVTFVPGNNIDLNSDPRKFVCFEERNIKKD